jgi:hypothetical protein
MVSVFIARYFRAAFATFAVPTARFGGTSEPGGRRRPGSRPRRPRSKGPVSQGQHRQLHRASVQVASGGLARVDSPPATTDNAVGKCGKPFTMLHLGVNDRRMIASQRGLLRRPDAKRPQTPGWRR